MRSRDYCTVHIPHEVVLIETEDTMQGTMYNTFVAVIECGRLLVRVHVAYLSTQTGFHVINISWYRSSVLGLKWLWSSISSCGYDVIRAYFS